MPPRRQQQSKKKPPGKPGVPTNTSAVEDGTEAADRFRVELQWCVQQLEASMKKASLKEREDMAKAHRTLTSSKAQHIKKRQVMSSLFGDYRCKMAQEESKIKMETPKMKKSSALPSESVFFRKSTVHSPDIITEPSTNSKEPAVSQEPEVTTSDSSGSGSTSGALVKEVNAGGGEEANFTGSGAKSLSPESLGGPKKVVTPFKATQSGSTFKFNFSVL